MAPHVSVAENQLALGYVPPPADGWVGVLF